MRRFVAEGCRVVVTDRSGQTEAPIDEFGPDAVAYARIDLSEPERAATLVDVAVDRWGRLDIVVANAGLMPSGSIESHRLDGVPLALEVNAVSTFVLAQAAAGHMGHGASIVINASVQGLQGHAGGLGYGGAPRS